MTTFWIKGKAGRTPPTKEEVSTTLKIGNKNINRKLYNNIYDYKRQLF